MRILEEAHNIAVHLGKSENMLTTAGRHFAKVTEYVYSPGTDGAQQLIDAGYEPTRDGIWKMITKDDAFPAGMGTSRRTCFRVLKIGKSDDPEAERQRYNEQAQEYRKPVTEGVDIDTNCNNEESEEEALAETRKEIAEQAKAPVHHEANQARRIVEAMGFDNLRVFDAWYMPHRAALIGPTDEVLALRAELAEWHKFRLAPETQSPLPTPKPRKLRDTSDPSPDEEAATKLWRSYLDMPSKSLWLTQQFTAINMGLPSVLKGQGDASFQLVRDYEAAPKEVRALFDTKLKTQQSDKKHKGDDF